MNKQVEMCEWCGKAMTAAIYFGCIVNVTFYPASDDDGLQRQLCLCGRCAKKFSDMLDAKTERLANKMMKGGV